MSVTTRQAPVVELSFPAGTDQQLAAALDLIRGAIGRVSQPWDLCLVAEPNGYTLTAAGGAGTAIPGATVKINFADMAADEVDLQVSGTGTGTVALLDGATTLASVALTGSLATSGWTRLAPASGDRTLTVKVIGNGVDSQTITGVHVRLRTNTYQP